MYGMESLETIWSNTVLQQPKTLCHHNLNRPKFAINDNDTKHLWVTFSGFNAEHKVYESKDGGNSWKNISQTLPNLPVHTIASLLIKFTGIKGP